MTTWFLAITSLLAGSAWAGERVAVGELAGNPVLTVDEEPFFVRGMNWGYIPVGHNYSYDFWGQDDAFIESALRYEMGLVKAAGINAIRQYDVIPPRWVEWIYDNYGIRTAINPLIGRYGATISGRWVPNVDYSDPATRKILTDMTLESVDKYKDTRGVLLYMLGNESNYGLHWSSFEIEALPEGERNDAKARHLYSLYGEITEKAQAIDPDHPVAIVNGDLGYIDLIAELMPTLDILGTNVYRGISSRDLYAEVQEKLGIPVMFTEFGADAYDARAGREDHLTQAKYLKGQWHEIYEQSATQGGVGNAIGGFVFQWSDGWWKYKQEENLDVHDVNASWPNGAYPEDFVEGQNNMNEEWFGICAKGKPDASGQFELYPRAAYYVLQRAWVLDPYAEGLDDAQIDAHFGAIEPAEFDQIYRTAQSAGLARDLSRARVKNVRLDLRTYTTGDTVRTNDRPEFDHLESFYADFEVNPADTVRGHVELNVLGNVAANPIDDLFYENRGRDTTTVGPDGEELSLASLERLRIYKAGFDIDTKDFRLLGYYREGHFHWGYEGDFWGLYPEAYYGPNIDIYDANAPIGFELHGKRKAEAFKLAFGPQVYWGANPTVIAKAYDEVGAWQLGLMHQEDFATQGQVVSTNAIPARPTRRTALLLGWSKYGIAVEAGGLMAGTERLGERFVYVQEARGAESYADSGYDVIEDTISWQDTLGSKLRVTVEKGAINWYAQGAVKGLVATSGVNARQTFTGFSLKESGQGNQIHASTGFMIPLGNFSVSPNMLWQKPLIGPNPAIEESFNPTTGVYQAAVRPRNAIADSFAVLDNRETRAAELLLVFDPTPGSWIWMWDNDLREDAPLAASLDLVYRIQPTSRDVTLGFSEEGYLFAFPNAPPAQNVWDATLRVVSAVRGDLRLVGHGKVGTKQARGDSDRLITAGGADLAMHHTHLSLTGAFAIDDWGPYDYHQDFNLTYPFQAWSEVAWRLGPHRLEVPPTRFGSTLKYRTLDEFSPGFASSPDATAGLEGTEWQFMTFVEVSL